MPTIPHHFPDLKTEYQLQDYHYLEEVTYPNGGYSVFYEKDNHALIIDVDICICDDKKDVFPYSLITDKQNAYMKKYDALYRVLVEDLSDFMADYSSENEEDYLLKDKSYDRANMADASPLEFLFEQNFANVYGMSSLKYLQKEYSIADRRGNQYFLDYVIHTKTGDIAVEENGVTYHHPQVIGIERYRKQLQKQNTCASWKIKLYRFSSEDCQFEERIEDDIRSYIGENTAAFYEQGLLLERSFELYDHQKITLQDIQDKRRNGIHSFLIVFPTASGKSKIVEEDLISYIKEHPHAHALILSPNKDIMNDWKDRADKTFSAIKDQVEIRTFAYMMRNYQEYAKNSFDYIVIDEAHHAVSPVLKRVIQYFTCDFLIGLTATDQRMDKKRLETIFGSYETGLSLQDAMEEGIVAQANVFRIETNLDLSQVRFNGKDYVNADLEKGIRVNSRNELIVDVLKEYFCGGAMEEKQGIIFCVNARHTKEMERLLEKSGLSARAYTSKEKNPEKIMADFKAKKIRFLCACNMISEGWDYPELGILVMARPTLSKVLYLQQIGRGLRRTDTKKNVFVIDVVDEYGAMAKPCTMHSIFTNAFYVPFGNIIKRNYKPGDMIEIDGIHEKVERIVEVDIENFEKKYGDYLNQEQLAREYYMSTGSITSWIKKGKITPSVVVPFGNRKIYLFSPEKVREIREEYKIAEHNDETMKDDFFDFLEERDYSLSYKMPFLLSLLKHMNKIGEANIEDVLNDYIAFYEDRIARGLQVDRPNCPYNEKTLKDKKKIQQNMLTNPFEKFERKRFLYYSKNLGMISMNHALFSRMQEMDYQRVEEQMKEDLRNYYKDMGV